MALHYEGEKHLLKNPPLIHVQLRLFPKSM